MVLKKMLPALSLLVIFAACRKDKDAAVKEKEFALTGFKEIYTSEKINLTIQEGSSFHIKAKGPRGNVDKLDLALTNEDRILDIAYKDGATSEVVDIVVTMPRLDYAYVSGDAVATVRGFQNQVGNVALALSGHARVTAHDGATVFAIDVTGSSQLFLNGHTASLAGEVSGNGVVNAYGLTATRVYLSTMQQAKAYVKPLHIFFGSAEGNSKIFYKGDPQDKELVTSGNGEIIKE